MTKIIAHRGFSAKYPENTMLAFREAVNAGCDGIEMDVHLSRDGEVVIIHDETLDRVSGRRGEVRAFTAEELGKIDVSAGFDAACGQNTIPTLREYFAFIRQHNVFTNIELKNSIFLYEGLEEKVIALIKEYGLLDKVLFSSFNHQSMVKSKQLSPRTECALLTDNHMVAVDEYMRLTGADYLNPIATFLTPGNIAYLRQANIRVQTWTVNREEDMEPLVDAGIYAIITDYPDRLRAVVERKRH